MTSTTAVSLTDNGSSVYVPSFSTKKKPRLPPPNRLDSTQLPSHKLRHSVWHDLRETDVKGNELNCPRVRKAPEKKEHNLYRVTDEDGNKLHHSKVGKDKLDHRNKTENWENCTDVNLSYQDLGHRYQLENFVRVLKRLIRVKRLNLADNTLTNLQSVSLPRCTHLTLRMNYFEHFKYLPKAPQLKILNLADNHIQTLDGLAVLRKRTPLESLDLRGNPLVFTENYRYRVFKTLPDLKELDGIPKLSTDDTQEYYGDNASSCVVS